MDKPLILLKGKGIVRARSGKQHQGTVTKRMESYSSLKMETRDFELERISVRSFHDTTDASERFCGVRDLKEVSAHKI